MIRAYDDYGNVIDMVEHDKQVRADALEEIASSRDFSDKVEIMFGQSYIPLNDLIELIDRLKEQK